MRLGGQADPPRRRARGRRRAPGCARSDRTGRARRRSCTRWPVSCRSRAACELWGRRARARIPRRERARLVALVPQQPVIPEGLTVEDYVLLGRTPHLGAAGDRATIGPRGRGIGARAARPRLGGRSGGWTRSPGASCNARSSRARSRRRRRCCSSTSRRPAWTSASRSACSSSWTSSVAHDGLTVLSTMHDLTLAGRFADRFALLSQGRLVVRGGPGRRAQRRA